MPGVIRKGHIKEFAIQQANKDSNISAKLKSLEAELLPGRLKDKFLYCANAFICTSENGLPDCFLPFVVDNILYLHAHQYPRCIVTAVLSVDVPRGCIILNKAHRVNSKVCAGDVQDWTVFRSEKFMYDCREGAIGDTDVRVTGKPPPVLHKLVLEIKPYFPESIAVSNENVAGVRVIDCAPIISAFAKSLLHCIVTTEEVHVVKVGEFCYIGRVNQVFADMDEEDGDEGGGADLTLSDDYRGLVDEFTAIFLVPDSALLLLLAQKDSSTVACNANNSSSSGGAISNSTVSYQLVNNPPLPPAPQRRDIVHIRTSDSEVFPVKRKLLRPCLALTAVVQAGKGKYKGDGDSVQPTDMVQPDASALASHSDETEGEGEVTAEVDVDACTFDRVLLYLEHAARGEQFRFDPLLASDLLEAATTLKVVGLQDVCNRVLGSFQERVCTVPIRLEEIVRRNQAGAAVAASGSKKRSETFLLMSGMVLDITRWLEEHPGGSTIIPEQALNVDCTLFFEIYHASRQAFLYLKEFYVGELAVEDRDKGGYMTAGTSGMASDAFLEQLNRITSSWRLDVNKMASYEMYKSF